MGLVVGGERAGQWQQQWKLHQQLPTEQTRRAESRNQNLLKRHSQVIQRHLQRLTFSPTEDLPSVNQILSGLDLK